LQPASDGGGPATPPVVRKERQVDVAADDRVDRSLRKDSASTRLLLLARSRALAVC
jgi:hypothetical protein